MGSSVTLLLLLFLCANTSAAKKKREEDIAPNGKLLLVHEVEPVELVELEELKPVDVIRPGVSAAASPARKTDKKRRQRQQQPQPPVIEKRLGKQYNDMRVRRIRPQPVPVPVVQPPTQPQVARQGSPDDLVSGKTKDNTFFF